MAHSRYLIATTEHPRVRRATDVTLVVFGLLVFLWSWRAYVKVEDLDAAVIDMTQWIPSWLSGTLSVLYGLAFVYAIGLFVAVLFQWKERFDAIRDMFLSVVMTALIGGDWPRYLPELGLAEPISQFPIYRVATVTALLRVVNPHLTRPMRRVGWTMIGLAAISGVGLGFGLPSSAFGAIGLGVAAAGVVLLVFGSPRGYPDMTSIEEALGTLGVPVSNVQLDDDQSWGVRRLIGDSDEYGRVEVKAYGRDATDSQLFARTWRYIWYRDTESSLALTRMQSVEHEALVTMMAARSGAPVPQVLAAGLGGDDVAILAVDRSGLRLSEMDPSNLGDDVLVDIWRSVAQLHDAGISHGGLTATAISIRDNGHQIGDFGSGTLGAVDSFQALDVVELLFALSLIVGVARAVESARLGLGDEALTTVLPYVQLPAIQSSSRRRVDRPKAVVAEIRTEIEAFAGAEAEEPVQIRRLQPKNLVMTGLSLFA